MRERNEGSPRARLDELCGHRPTSPWGYLSEVDTPLHENAQGEILRCALQKLDELLVSVEQFRPSGREGVLPAFSAPRTSSALSILDPRRGSIE